MREPDGFREFVIAETPGLFRQALLLSHDWQLAEDLVQETVTKVLTKWRLVSRAESPRAYAHGILTREFLSMARKRSYTERPAELDLPAGVEPWDSIDTQIALARSLAKLSPDERVVVVGRYVDGRPAADIAADLNRNEGWVRVTAHRALAKLREDGELHDMSGGAG